jgi:hypothetical protein
MVVTMKTPPVEKNKTSNSFKMKRIDVSKEIIESGVRCNGTYCIVNEAVKRTLQKMGLKAKAVFTDLQMIRFSLPEIGKRFLFFCPRSAQVALLKFDQGKDVNPFHFHLGTPAQVVDMYPCHKDPVLAGVYQKKAQAAKETGDKKLAARYARTASTYRLGAPRRGGSHAPNKSARLKLAGKGRSRRHVKIGGAVPPAQTVLSSTDRQFGLRSFVGAFA